MVSTRTAASGCNATNRRVASTPSMTGICRSMMAMSGRTDPNQPRPPLAVIITDSVIGLVSLIAVVWTWRTATRAGARIVAGTRILSVLTALPAFFVSGVPAGVVAMVAV